MVNGLSSITSYSITSHLDTGYLINLDNHQITSHVIKLSFLWLVIIPKQTQLFWYPPRRSVYSETRHPIVPRDAPGFWKRVKIMGKWWEQYGFQKREKARKKHWESKSMSIGIRDFLVDTWIIMDMYIYIYSWIMIYFRIFGARLPTMKQWDVGSTCGINNWEKKTQLHCTMVLIHTVHAHSGPQTKGFDMF
jgi:hypothetical protein